MYINNSISDLHIFGYATRWIRTSSEWVDFNDEISGVFQLIDTVENLYDILIYPLFYYILAAANNDWRFLLYFEIW